MFVKLGKKILFLLVMMSTSSEWGEGSMISVNKRNETLRNVQPRHNTRSNEV